MHEQRATLAHAYISQIYIKLEFPECVMCQPSRSIVSLTCLWTGLVECRSIIYEKGCYFPCSTCWIAENVTKILKMCQTVHIKWHAESRHIPFFHLGVNFFIRFLAFPAWKMWRVSSQPHSLQQVAELPLSLTRKACELSIRMGISRWTTALLLVGTFQIQMLWCYCEYYLVSGF